MPLPVSKALDVVTRWQSALSTAAGPDKRLSAGDRSAAQAALPDQAEALDHFIAAARVASGPTVTVSDLETVAKAAATALVTAAGPNAILSQAERARLPMIARMAAVAADGGTVQSSTLVARTWAEGRDFGGVWRHTLRTDRDAASLPDAVKQSVRAWREWEDADLGSVSLYAVKNTLPRLFAVHTTTDGDDGFLELYDEEGRGILSGTTTITADASGALQRGIVWDDGFASVRAALQRLQPPPGATFQSRFEAAFTAATGAPISPTVTAVSETSTHIDLDLQLGRATASARIVRTGGQDVLSVSRVQRNGPVQDPGRLSSMEAALRADPRFTDAVVIAVGQRSTLNETFNMVLFRSGGVERTARIGYAGAGLTTPALTTMNDANCAREIAIALATEEALRLATQAGPLAELEVLSRTFNGGARLTVDEPAAAERYGFNPATDHKQVLVSGLWGSSAAYVTFTRDGGHRLDWMN